MKKIVILKEKREDLSLVHGLKTVAREGRTPVVEEDPRAENTEKRPKLQLQSYFFPSLSMWLKPNRIHLNRPISKLKLY